MATQITGTVKYTLSTGARGPEGLAGATGPPLNLTAGPVRSTAGTSTIADGALTIAKTAGLQAALDSKMKSRPYVSGSNGGMRAFRSRLDRGQSAACLIISDSTGVPSNSWPYLFSNSLATRYPAARVLRRVTDYTTGASATTTVVQAGTTRQHWEYGPTVTTNGAYCLNDNFRTQLGGRYLGIEVEMAPTSDAALSGGYPTDNVGMAGYGTGSVLGWLELSTTGRLSAYWSDGSGFQSVSSTNGQPVPQLVVGTYVRYRVLIDTDNGSTRSIQFHYSTNNGDTWTQVGSTLTPARSASPNVSATTTQSVFIGRSNTVNAKVGYRYSHMQLMTGANYEPILPERIDAFTLSGGVVSGSPTLGGNPTIFVDIVAVNAASILASGYFGATLPTHAWNLLRDRWHDFVAISSSHNDTGLEGGFLASRMNALRALVAGRGPASYVPNFIHITQNPETSPYYSW
ncbi:MAG: hypothetical protein RLZZ214_4191, partial [Verrucomicrobiota bacterium]